MINRVTIMGHITRDIELKYTPSGVAIARIGMATNRHWKDKATGEDKEEAMFIDVDLFGRTAEIANQYLSKGKRTHIEGRLVLQRWNDQNGQPRSKHVIVGETLTLIDKAAQKEQENAPTTTTTANEDYDPSYNDIPF